MLRHGVATDAAKAKSGKSCERVRGSRMQGTVGMVGGYQEAFGEQAKGLPGTSRTIKERNRWSDAAHFIGKNSFC